MSALEYVNVATSDKFPQNMAKFAKEIPKRLFVALARDFYFCLHSPKKNPIRVCHLLGFLSTY
jgi:hypothetical protein